MALLVRFPGVNSVEVLFISSFLLRLVYEVTSVDHSVSVNLSFTKLARDYYSRINEQHVHYDETYPAVICA